MEEFGIVPENVQPSEWDSEDEGEPYISEDEAQVKTDEVEARGTGLFFEDSKDPVSQIIRCPMKTESQHTESENQDSVDQSEMLQRHDSEVVQKHAESERRVKFV